MAVNVARVTERLLAVPVLSGTQVVHVEGEDVPIPANVDPNGDFFVMTTGDEAVRVAVNAFEYVNSAELAANLALYSTTTELNAVLEDFTTTDALVATLNSYATKTDLASNLVPYVTTAELNATLPDYATKAELGVYARNDQDLNFGYNLTVATTKTLTCNTLVVTREQSVASSTSVSLPKGTVFWDSSFLYIAVSTSQIKRVALTAF